MRIHRPLAEAAASLVAEVFEDGRVLDRVMATAFRRNRKWGKRDRHFVAESVWEVVRWRRALAFVADAGGVPDLLAAAWRRMGYDLPEWWQRGGVAVEAMAAREEELSEQSRAVRESVPDWLDARGAEELGADWPAMLTALNRRAPVFLRVNRLLAGREEVLDWLASEGVDAAAVEELPEGIRLAGTLPKRLADDPRVEIQDGGSQQIAPMLAVEPGMRVIDACAGAGGKTLHLAALMQGRGEIVALDVSERKLARLEERARRAGVRNLRVERWRGDTVQRWRGWADRVMVDAPCSGLGTLRRQPDLKWRLSEKWIDEVRETQREIFERSADLLDSSGELVYATCSVLPSENEMQLADLLEREPEWEVAAERRIVPGENGFDGFYVSRLIRQAGDR